MLSKCKIIMKSSTGNLQVCLHSCTSFFLIPCRGPQPESLKNLIFAVIRWLWRKEWTEGASESSEITEKLPRISALVERRVPVSELGQMCILWRPEARGICKCGMLQQPTSCLQCRKTRQEMKALKGSSAAGTGIKEIARLEHKLEFNTASQAPMLVLPWQSGSYPSRVCRDPVASTQLEEALCLSVL